jgi:hypothetical protein
MRCDPSRKDTYVSRLLVANAVEGTGIHAGTTDTARDLRSWTQRILWFVRPGDTILASTEPDHDFAQYVHQTLGYPSLTPAIVLSGGRFDGKFLDPITVLEHFTSHTHAYDDVVAFWPGSWLADLISLTARAADCQQHTFFRSGGGELLNSKAGFRLLAAGLGLPLPDGAVCHTPDAMRRVLHQFITAGQTAVVKRSHAAAGTGNEIITPGNYCNLQTAGGRHLSTAATSDEVSRYVSQRWPWASEDDRHPVVVEEFVPNSTSIYIEYILAEHGLSSAVCGELRYRDRWLVEESVPLDATNHPVDRLRTASQAYAQFVWQLGYRGPLGLDAVHQPSTGRVVFTEANTRVSGSTHLYQVFQKLAAHPALVEVTQCQAPDHWTVGSTAEFLDKLQAADLLAQAGHDHGVLLVHPIIDRISTQKFLYAVLHTDRMQLATVRQKMESLFG